MNKQINNDKEGGVYLIQLGKQIAENIRRSQNKKKCMLDKENYVDGESFERWLKYINGKSFEQYLREEFKKNI